MSAPVNGTYRLMDGKPLTIARPPAHAASEPELNSPLAPEPAAENPGMAFSEPVLVAHSEDSAPTQELPELPVGDDILSSWQGKYYYHEDKVEPDRPWGKLAKAQYRLKHGHVPDTLLHPDQIAELEAQAESERRERHREVEAFRLQEYHKLLVKRLKYLVNELLIQPIIGADNGKSSGKTHDLVGVGSEFAWHTRRFVVLVPATRSQSTVTAGAIAGIKRTARMLTASQFMEAVSAGQKFDPANIQDIVGMTDAGLGVFIENPEADSLGDDLEASTKFVKAADVLISGVPIVLFDKANDDYGKQGAATIPRMAGRLCHAQFHPFDDAEPTTKDTARGTILRLNDTTAPQDSDGDGNGLSDNEKAALEGFRSKARTGLHKSLRYKAEHAPIVANRAPLGKYTREHVIGLTVPFGTPVSEIGSKPELLQWKGELITVPEEKTFNQVDAHGEPVPFDFFALTLETHIGYLEIAVKCTEQAGLVMENNPFEDATYLRLVQAAEGLLKLSAEQLVRWSKTMQQ